MAIKKWFLVCALSGAATLVFAYPDADRQGKVYKGLQDVHSIADFQGINPQDTTLRWEIGDNNLIEWLLAPWDESKVNEAFDAYRQEYGSIAETAEKVVYGAIAGNFDASGHQITDDELKQLLNIVKQTDFIQTFHSEARAITTADTDAQFFPSDVFFTNNLAQASNVAANQKSSSTLIPRNTPVFVLGQLMTVDSSGLEPADDSWLALWRPEFGLKFAKARHVAFVDKAMADDFPVTPQDIEPDNRLKLTCTSRVKHSGCSKRFPLGTPIFIQGGQHLMAQKDQQEPTTITVSSTKLRLYSAQLSFVNLSVDPAGELDQQVRKVPLPLSYHNYLNQLSSTLLKYPTEYVAPEYNENRHFAFGEGTIGPDGERGMDASTFALKLIQPFGKWLPRYSVHQVEEGIKSCATEKATLEENYHAMLDHCPIGNFVSVGSGNNMACLGSITLEQLGQISPEAKADAIGTGGMTEQDRVPLLAMSATGITNLEEVIVTRPSGTLEIPSTGETLQVSSQTMEQQAVWYITGKAAVYPVFKSGYLSSYIRDGRSLTFYSYFTPKPLIQSVSPVLKSKL
ncbi:hypothetical protein [Endozoicomonas sp.]|uniref:hypothetical protein n=1 Tax=Endozoicomonas sp. TaxID=1892382 RepID=UPI003AF4D286